MKQGKPRVPIMLLLSIAIILDTLPICAQTSSPLGFDGIVSKSDRHKVGSKFTFANVSSYHPFVTYPSGFGNEIDKKYEDDELIVFIFVAVTGSTEIYYLNKKTKRFTIIEVGVHTEETVAGRDITPKVTYGNLK